MPVKYATMVSSRCKMLSVWLLLLVSWQKIRAFAPRHASRPMTPSIPTRTRTSSLQMNMEASAMLTALDSFYQTQPYQAAFLTCSFKASAADFITQKRQEATEQDSLDMSRNLAFILYGGLYQGVCQQFIYNTLFPMVFGTETSLLTVAEQVALDMVILTPLLCLPAAYLIKSSIDSEETWQQGLEKYWMHVKQEGLLLKYWMLWVPVQSLTFGVIPAHLRIAFIASVSFVWLMILSQISSSSQEQH